MYLIRASRSIMVLRSASDRWRCDDFLEKWEAAYMVFGRVAAATLSVDCVANCWRNRKQNERS